MEAGIIQKISLQNFLCHEKLEIDFNKNINFVIGKNGSGKSAVLTGLVVALGEKANTTSRGPKVSNFIKTGESKAVVSVTLANQGQGAYKQDVYGDFITIERTILAGGSSYKLFNEQGNMVSKQVKELKLLLAKMNLQVDNPICILNQETAKNFLHSNDPKAKFELFEQATQLDDIFRFFSDADHNIDLGKACLEEKKQCLSKLNAEVKKLNEKVKWYDSISEIHGQQAKLENMIAWAQVELYEKKAEDALAKQNNQKTEIEKTQKKLQDMEEKLHKLEEDHRGRKDELVGKAEQLRVEREASAEAEREHSQLKRRLAELKSEVSQLDIVRRRCISARDSLIKEIEDKKRAISNSEWAHREEIRKAELTLLKDQEVSLNAVKTVSEHQVSQLRGAIAQLRNESGSARSELTRLQKECEFKSRQLNELRRSSSNAFAVFGDWVPGILREIEKAHFRGPKPRGPLGAYIKLKDKSWAPVVELYLGGMLQSFICSNDEDSKQLHCIVDKVLRANQSKPRIITSSMTGKVFNVSTNKVHLPEEFGSKDIHCLMDLLVIEDPDVANILIDLQHIEQVLMISHERDAQFYLSEQCRVPRNCVLAMVKDGNKYYPDPNYRSYGGRAHKSARYLQASVEDAIRNLEEDLETTKRGRDEAKEKIQGFENQIRMNQGHLENEERKLSQNRLQWNVVVEKIRHLETQSEPEPTDVAALEEDLLDQEEKLEKAETEKHLKMTLYDEVKQKAHEASEAHRERRRIISTLEVDGDPLTDFLSNNKRKQNECKEAIDRFKAAIARMKDNLVGFERDYVEAKDKAESEAVAKQVLCDRVQVTKSLASLLSELKQMKEHVAAQEREMGTRTQVREEFNRRSEAFNRAVEEVKRAQSSLKKLVRMKTERKRFIENFRRSIMIRTHHMFQDLLRQRHFEGSLEFDIDHRTLELKVLPPGREELPEPAAKRSRLSGRGATDLRSLSGGERSYSTLCFILALWDAIESPFRILDEFDVYMDPVNRAMSLNLLLTMARENSTRQFILLTPLGLEQEQIDSSVSVFKMQDPERD